MVVPFLEASFTHPWSTDHPPTRLRLWREAGGSWTEVDLVAQRIVNLKLDVSYSHPRRLSFTALQPQHSLPFTYREGVVFTDETFGGFGTPLFEGFIHEIRPAAANEVHFVAYDATKRASEEVFIQNAPAGSPSAIPRLVYNCKNPNDEDKAFERRENASVGEILGDLLSDNYILLVGLLAAPPPQVGGPAYHPSELDLLDFIPQEKIVFDSETLRGGLSRMLAYYPGVRLLFHPGHYRRTWRLVRVKQSPEVVLTLNEFSSTQNPVLTLSLERSLENRWTAVRIFGPERTVGAVAQVGDESLTPMWSPAEATFLEASGPQAVGPHVGTTWQVSDESKRHLAKLLPAEVLVPTSALRLNSASVSMGLSFARTRRPALVASWDGGDHWEPIGSIRLDMSNGVVTAPYAVAKQAADGSWSLPDDVRFYFAYYDEPLSARFPSSGFAGSAFDSAGVETELQLYDESLAVGYEYGVPVTTQERVDEFVKLAESLHAAYCDVVHAGGCTLDGLDYQFLNLDRRVHFAAVDADGQPLMTGWEDAAAILTDVEYDFTQRLTTLQFSSDQLEYMQTDPEQLKRRLKIRPYRTYQWTEFVVQPGAGAYSQSFRTHFAHVPIPEEEP